MPDRPWGQRKSTVMALKGPTPVDLPAVLVTPVEYGSRVRPKIYALHDATRHTTSRKQHNPGGGNWIWLRNREGSWWAAGDVRVPQQRCSRHSCSYEEGTQRNHWVLRRTQTLILNTSGKFNFAYKVSIKDRLTDFTTISYFRSISSSSFESRHPIGRTCQRCLSND